VKKANVGFIPALAVLLLAAGVCLAQVLPLKFKAGFDKIQANVGDKVRYSLEVSGPENIEVRIPGVPINTGNFTVDDAVLGSSAWFGTRKTTRGIIARSFTLGKNVLPKENINYRHKSSSQWSVMEIPEQSIEIKSLLDKNTVLRDIKGPVGSPVAGNFVSLVILAVFLVAAGLTLVYFNRKKERQEKIIKRSAHEIAYEQLERLRVKDLISSGRIKEFYSEISDIVRRYLENRFGFKASEMTTEEFLAKVRESSSLNSGHKSLLREFLFRCDMVKFAKYLPQARDSDGAFDAAKNFVDQTKQNDDPA